MPTHDIAPELAPYLAQYGPWTAHNIRYQPGKYTHGTNIGAPWFYDRCQTFAYWIEQQAGKPISECTVLDLGCLEGGVSFYIAEHGADVTGIEIRESAIGHCKFLNKVRPELKMRFIQGDMLKLDSMNLGPFDAVIAAGMLYHVDAPDLLPFLQSLRRATKRVLLVDTHVSHKLLETFTDPATGTKLYGRSLREHMPGVSAEAREDSLWGSKDNEFSFWPTETSLANALVASGFDYCFKPLTPRVPYNYADRILMLAGITQRDQMVKRSGTPLLEPDPRTAECPRLNKKVQQSVDNPGTLRV